MNNREELQSILEDILGSSEVYFQPPENLKINYPAIVYSLNRIATASADNKPYVMFDSYQVTMIDKNPVNETVKKLAKLPLCRFDRTYRVDNLNHYVFTIFY